MAHTRTYASEAQEEVAAARRDLEKQTALAAKAGEEAGQINQTADSAAELQKSPEQERAAHLEQDVAAARRDLEKHTARAAKASRQARRTKRMAAAGWFKSNSIWTLNLAIPPNTRRRGDRVRIFAC